MKYKLYQSKLIEENFENFVQECWDNHADFKNIFPKGNSTWNYHTYNIFALTCSSTLFYYLFKELNFHIRSFIGDGRPLWMQSWLNFHSSDEVLKQHSHEWSYHGYISIDPKNTTTVFNNFEIKNKIGQIYLGPGGEEYSHYVKVNEPYNDKRITLGFDISDNRNYNFNSGNLTSFRLGLIPLI